MLVQQQNFRATSPETIPPISMNGFVNVSAKLLRKENQIQTSLTIFFHDPDDQGQEYTTGSGRDNSHRVLVIAPRRNKTIGSQGKLLSGIFILPCGTHQYGVTPPLVKLPNSSCSGSVEVLCSARTKGPRLVLSNQLSRCSEIAFLAVEVIVS